MEKYFIIFAFGVVLFVTEGQTQQSTNDSNEELRCVEAQCSQCTRPNEHYECGSACQTQCSTLNMACPIVNIRCNDACYCDDGFARNENGVCIPISQCP